MNEYKIQQIIIILLDTHTHTHTHTRTNTHQKKTMMMMIRERFELPAVGCLLNEQLASSRKKIFFFGIQCSTNCDANVLTPRNNI